MAIDKALKPHDNLSRNKKPVLVCILDGWGENVAKDKYNAIHSAETPVTGTLVGKFIGCLTPPLVSPPTAVEISPRAAAAHLDKSSPYEAYIGILQLLYALRLLGRWWHKALN